MRVVVLGAGLVGGRLLARLVAAGHDARAFTRALGVDTTTGAGVAEAVAGADVVVDVTNPRAGSEGELIEFFRSSTTHQLAAEAIAGVGHHVVLSVVGCDRVTGSGYLRAKAVQEQLVASGPVPWSIVRSTQFFEFIGTIADASTLGGTVRVPPATLQPIAARDVTARLAHVVGGPPSGVVESPDRSACLSMRLYDGCWPPRTTLDTSSPIPRRTTSVPG